MGRTGGHPEIIKKGGGFLFNGINDVLEKIQEASTNIEAIQSATIKAAQLNRMEDKIGSLEMGKEADLIVIRGKPDINLDDLENVEQVFINGKRMI